MTRPLFMDAKDGIDHGIRDKRSTLIETLIYIIDISRSEVHSSQKGSDLHDGTIIPANIVKKHLEFFEGLSRPAETENKRNERPISNIRYQNLRKFKDLSQSSGDNGKKSTGQSNHNHSSPTSQGQNSTRPNIKNSNSQSTANHRRDGQRDSRRRDASANDLQNASTYRESGSMPNQNLVSNSAESQRDDQANSASSKDDLSHIEPGNTKRVRDSLFGSQSPDLNKTRTVKRNSLRIINSNKVAFNSNNTTDRAAARSANSNDASASSTGSQPFRLKRRAPPPPNEGARNNQSNPSNDSSVGQGARIELSQSGNQQSRRRLGWALPDYGPLPPLPTPSQPSELGTLFGTDPPSGVSGSSVRTGTSALPQNLQLSGGNDDESDICSLASVWDSEILARQNSRQSDDTDASDTPDSVVTEEVLASLKELAPWLEQFKDISEQYEGFAKDAPKRLSDMYNGVSQLMRESTPAWKLLLSRLFKEECENLQEFVESRNSKEFNDELGWFSMLIRASQQENTTVSDENIRRIFVEIVKEFESDVNRAFTSGQWYPRDTYEMALRHLQDLAKRLQQELPEIWFKILITAYRAYVNRSNPNKVVYQQNKVLSLFDLAPNLVHGQQPIPAAA